MSLADTMRGLHKKSAQSGQTEKWRLKNGLRVGINAAEERFWATRDEGSWGPDDERSLTEGRVCAKYLGWENITHRWNERYLIIEKVESLL